MGPLHPLPIESGHRDRLLCVDTVTRRRFYVLFFEIGSRRLRLGGITHNPTSRWTPPQAPRNLLMDLPERSRFVVHDGGGQYAGSFDTIFTAAASNQSRRRHEREGAENSSGPGFVGVFGHRVCPRARSAVRLGPVRARLQTIVEGDSAPAGMVVSDRDDAVHVLLRPMRWPALARCEEPVWDRVGWVVGTLRSLYVRRLAQRFALTHPSARLSSRGSAERAPERCPTRSTMRSIS